MSVLMLADPLTHIVFKEEYARRYGKLSALERVRYRFRSRVIISGYTFLRYVNGLGRELVDRRLNTFTKYGLNHNGLDADYYPLYSLSENLGFIEKDKLKAYSNYSYAWKDNSKNLKKDYVKEFE